MNESDKDSGQMLIAHNQASKVLQPGVSPLDNPAALIPAQLAPILMRGDLVVRASRNDWLNLSLDQQGPRGIAVIRSVSDQAFGITPLPPTGAQEHTVQGRFQQFYFR